MNQNFLHVLIRMSSFYVMYLNLLRKIYAQRAATQVGFNNQTISLSDNKIKTLEHRKLKWCLRI